VGKIYLFYGAVQSGLWWLALAGVINSFISAYYYLRPIRAMYVTTSNQGETRSEDAIDETAETPAPSLGLRASLGLSIAGIIVLGLAPAWLIARATEAAQALAP
jgi:NADH-quinone oxidoreductase subunit N